MLLTQSVFRPHQKRSNSMRPRIVLSIAVTLVIASGVATGQTKPASPEPAIPVYVVCPYHEDSLRAVYESAFPTATSALGVLSKRTDTLTAMVQKSSVQLSTNLTWIYALLILVTLMNIVLLATSMQMRRQVARLRANDPR
jgi:hypothetical protein